MRIAESLISCGVGEGPLKILETLGSGRGACCTSTCVHWSRSTSLPSISLNGFRSNWVVHMNVVFAIVQDFCFVLNGNFMLDTL